MFEGILTAPITPFRNGAVDEGALASFAEWQIDCGVHGLVPAGTTGETPCLEADEQRRVVEVVVEATAGRVPVVAGCGGNSTDKTIKMAKSVLAAGADALLVVVPYYNKPMPEGQYLHFKAIHDAVDAPIILYNIPGRSVVDMSPETMGRLAKDCPNIVAVKDATGDMARVALQRDACVGGFTQLSGDDDTFLDFMKQGGQGCISVASNVAPAEMVEIYNHAKSGHWDEAAAVNNRLMSLFSALSLETNPGPIKYAAHLKNICTPDMRLPMIEPSDENKAKIKQVMDELGLID